MRTVRVYALTTEDTQGIALGCGQCVVGEVRVEVEGGDVVE